MHTVSIKNSKHGIFQYSLYHFQKYKPTCFCDVWSCIFHCKSKFICMRLNYLLQIEQYKIVQCAINNFFLNCYKFPSVLINLHIFHAISYSWWRMKLKAKIKLNFGMWLCNCIKFHHDLKSTPSKSRQKGREGKKTCSVWIIGSINELWVEFGLQWWVTVRKMSFLAKVSVFH